MTLPGIVRRRLFGVPSARAVFEGRGFSPNAWPRFRHVAETLVHGYHAALHDPRPAQLHRCLSDVPAGLAGIAYEGAGMGLAALDLVAPWRSRVTEFAAGPAERHRYPFYVGVGLAYARLGQSPEQHLADLDPLLGWVTADGYGFHQAFFRRRPHPPYVSPPRQLTRFGCRMFDQGVGRALWFSLAADPGVVNLQLKGFQQHRHRDLWTGVGLAAAYGGGADRSRLHQVRQLAADYRAELAVGAATAAWGRTVADDPADHTDLACRVFAGCGAATAAEIAASAQVNLPLVSAVPTLEVWRQRILAGLPTLSSQQQTPVTANA